MRDRLLLPLFAALLIVSAAAVADPATPVISIIIDDVGYRHLQDREVLELPGPLAVAILPHSPHAAE
ncbi:MAG TPA: divergent polysaccharide deacetylase family protein, partial [Gammaproteobacteria bacterium]